tara:strand:- start:66 stop:293 length:228 start_codon:yes stop_codon:yes gene_type:complete
MQSTIKVLLTLARTHTLTNQLQQDASQFSLLAILEEVILPCHANERTANFNFNIKIKNDLTIQNAINNIVALNSI